MKRLALILVGFLFSSSATILHAQTSQHRDIGAVAVAGSAANSGTSGFTITASGADIWGTADEFHYLYFSLTGDMELIAEVTGIQLTDGWAKAGLMARETLDANSRNIMVFAIPQNYAGFQWRAVTGGGSTYTPGGTFGFPSWLRLVRSGNTFSGYQSADGNNWTLIGSTTIALPSTLWVGLAVTSHKDGALCTATFDNVTHVSNAGGAIVPRAPSNLNATPVGTTQITLSWTDNATDENAFTVERSTDGINYHAVALMSANSNTYGDTGLNAGTRYWYRVFASNAAGNSPRSNVAQATTASGSGSSDWYHEDVGAVAAPGNFGQSGSTHTVSGSGFDIWGEHDEFHYAYQRGTNNVEIAARITGIANSNPWAKAGVMIRESQMACYDVDHTCDIYEVDFGANVMLALTPSHGLAFQWRPQQGGPTFYADAGPASAPVWVKLVKSGTTFTGYRSPDGVNWTQVGTATVNMGSTSSLSLGLAVTSHNDGIINTANFDNITIEGGIGGDSGVPNAPTDLKVVGVSSSFVSLTWDDTNTNETDFRLERSTDGVNFQTITNLPYGSPYYNSYSYVDNGLSPATHYWYRVFASNNAGSSPPSNLADATTGASAWRDQDIGTVSAAGSFSQSGSTLTVRGSGSDIWGNADEFNYAYQSGTNNAQIVARITGMANTSPWAKAGVMIRASVAAGSQHVILALTPGNGLAFQWRAATDGPSSYVDAGAATAPVWVKLVKTGDNFIGYRSADGVNWTQVGSVNIALPGSTFLVGLAVTSDNDGTICAANFENVSITNPSAVAPAAPTGLAATAVSSSQINLTWTDNSINETTFRIFRSTNGTSFATLVDLPSDTTTYSDTSLPAATHFWYFVAALNSAGISSGSGVADATTLSGGGSTSGWQDQDIGAVNAAGGFNQSGNTFTVGGSGFDIWDNNDEFHYAYQSAAGDAQIVARITGMANTSPWAKAGVMVRQSLAVGAPNVLLALTPGYGLAFQWRSVSGGQTTYIDAGAASAPVWVKLVRTSDTVTGYRSADGNNWTQVASVTIASSSQMLVGLAVTSHNDGTVCLANFDNVTITASGAGGGGNNAVPAAPSGLTATATSSNNITLHWQDNATNESGFVLERSTDGTSFIQIGTFPANNQTAVEVVNPGTHHWYRVAATNSFGRSPYSNIAEATTPAGGGNGGGSLPSPWQSQNVGDVSVGGSATASQGTFTLKGSGTDIWGTSDAFYFAYQTVSFRGDGLGDGELIARVTGLQNTDPWAKAGIMFRQVLSANFANVGNAKNVFVMATPEHGTGMQSRAETGGGSTYLPGPYFSAPVWLRLKREGNLFTGYSSLDGVNWTVIGSQTVTTTGPVVAGVAVTSHNNTVLNTASFDNVTWTPAP